MDTGRAKLARLALLIQRTLDADALCDTVGASLLTQTEAARQCLVEGDTEAVRRYIAQVALCTEALGRAEGQTLLETAYRLLARDAE